MLKEKTVQRFRPGAAFSYGYLGRSSQPAERSLAEELARDHGLRLITDWPMLALSVRCFVAQVAPGQDPAKVTERLEADKRVESAQVMQLFKLARLIKEIPKGAPAFSASKKYDLSIRTIGNRRRSAFTRS